MKTKKTTKTTKTTKTAKKAATKKQAKPVAKCVLCGAEIKGTGHNPNPLATEGACCDECNVKVLEERMKLAVKSDRAAKRREYAKAYYAANREKLVAASSRSHAKRAAESKALLNEVLDALEGIVSEHGTESLERYCDVTLVDRLAAFLRRV